MKALTVEKAQEIRAGKGHYHWICRDWANFTSKAYSSYAAADSLVAIGAATVEALMRNLATS